MVSETSIPTLATPTSTLHVISTNGDYGPSQDRLYDNLDQYAYLELDASLIEGPRLDCKTIYELEQWIYDTSKRSVNILNAKEKEPDGNHWQRCLGYFPMDIIIRTKDCTTNYGVHHDVGILKRYRKSRNPQLNRKRLMEKYATDTWYASVKAVTGETCAQIFVGMSSFYTCVIGMKTESEGPQALKIFIRQLGAPFSLRNDNSKMQTGTVFMDVCNFYNIGTETTEPHHPEQNPAEN